MDATKRPFQIPPEFGLYADKHGIFDLNKAYIIYHAYLEKAEDLFRKRLLEQLIINKPDDPIQFLIEALTKENDDVPNILILGPPASGKHVIGRMLAGRLGCPHLTVKDVLQQSQREVKAQAEEHLRNKEPIPTSLWVKALKERTSLFDCNRKGWVLSGFPQTREQAIACQSEGIFANHVVILEAPDSVLIERAKGKRVDPKTGDIYHVNFDPPMDVETGQRLAEVPGNTRTEMPSRLAAFHRTIYQLSLSYSGVLDRVNADQPMVDVLTRVLEIVLTGARSVAPRNPYLLLLGPPGSGKSTQATLLASKYKVVDVDCGLLVKQAIADQSKLGSVMRSYVDRNAPVPDPIILQLLKDRLCKVDCLTRGWVLHGYPRNRGQAEQLDLAGFQTNRVFLLDIPSHAVVERLTNKRLDPVTGTRYHQIYNPATEDHVQSRLVQNAADGETAVQRKLTNYASDTEDLTDYYETLQIIPADQDIHAVFEMIEAGLVNQIPTKISETVD